MSGVSFGVCAFGIWGGGGGIVRLSTRREESQMLEECNVNSPLIPFHHQVPQRDISSTPANYVLLCILSQM